MNKTWLKKYVLPAVLAVAVPIAANAGEFTFSDIDGAYGDGNGNVLGTVLGTSSVSSILGTTGFTGSDFGPNSTYNLGVIKMTTDLSDTGEAAAVVVGDTEGKLNLGGDIFVTNTANETKNRALHGIFISGDTFSGQILGGKNITVINTATSDGTTLGAAEAYGVRLLGTTTNPQGGVPQGGVTAGAVIELGTVTVQGNGFTAGMVVGDIATGAKVHIAKTIVHSSDGAAVGVHVNTAGINTGEVGGGELVVDDVVVTSDTSGVTGVIFSTGGGDMIPTESGTKTKIGNMTVQTSADGAAAIGITGSDLKNTTFTGTVIAKSANGDGYAVVTEGDADINVEGNAKFEGSSGGVKTEGAVKVGGEGTIDLGKVVQEGTDQGFTVGADTSVIMAADSTLDGGTKTNNGSVTIVGETVDTSAVENTWSGAGGNGSLKVETDMGNYELGDGGLVSTGTSSVSNGVIAATSVHQTYSTWNTVRNHMISAGDFGGGASGGGAGDNSGDYRGQECDPCDPIGACDPCGSFGNKQLQRTAWVNYIGRGEEYNGANASKWNLGVDGVQAGTDLYVTRRNQLGVNLGYEKGDLVNGLNSVDSENMYLGLYGAHIFRTGWDVRGSFTYGWQEFDMIRAGSNGTSLYGSNVDGNTTESSIEFGKRFARGAWSLRPVFGVDVMTTALDASKESALNLGGNALSYSKGDMTQVFLRTGAELRWQKRRLGFNSGIFYSYDVDNDTMVIQAKNDAAASTVLSGTDVGREMLMFNVGGSYALGRNFTVFGGYQGQAVLNTDSDAYQNVGYVGGAWKW